MTEEPHLDDIPAVSHHDEREAMLAAVMLHSTEPDEPATPQDRRKRTERRSHLIRRARLRRLMGGGLILSMALLTLLALQAWVGRPPPVIEVTPPSLIGTWVTDAENYADRAFVITQDYLELHVGDGVVTHHSILSLRGVQEADHWAYQVAYLSPEGEFVLEFSLHADGSLRLKNPFLVVWTRQ